MSSNILSSNTLANPNTALYGGGLAGVSQLIAGTNVSLSPAGGTGVVTVNATSGGVTQLIGGQGIAVDPVGGTGIVTVNSVIDQVGNGTIFATPSANGTATIWEVGDFLFCAVAINVNTLTPGVGQFSLPSGLAWANSTGSAIWPQVICSAVANGTGALVPGTFIASAQPSQPTSPTLNNRITVQCTDATGAAQVATMVNALAFGPKAV